MSMFSPPSVPNVPDWSTVANTQQNYNTQSAIQSQAMSNVNQYNPWGSLTYSQTGMGPGGVPTWSANVQLTPQQQALFDTYQKTKGIAGQQGQSLLSNADYGSSDPSKVIGDATQGNTAALMALQNKYLDPFNKTQKAQLDATLRSQGLFPGQPGYDNAMRQLDVNQGLVQSQNAAQFEGQAYNQARLNFLTPAELSMALANFGQAGNVKDGLVDTPKANVQPANAVGAASNQSQAQMSAYDKQAAQYANMMTGVFGVPASILGGWAKSPSGGDFIGSLFSGVSGGNSNPFTKMGSSQFGPNANEMNIGDQLGSMTG